MQTQDSPLIRVGDVELCAETFGAPGDPPLLLIGNSMLTWPDGLCARLAEGGRFVVRYDLRDTGRSTFADPEAPSYSLRDLVADAAGLLDALGIPSAHVAGYGVGGWIAQLLALDHPEKVASVTLIATRPTAPGRADPDLPEHAAVVMQQVFGAPPARLGRPRGGRGRDGVLGARVRRRRALRRGGGARAGGADLRPGGGRPPGRRPGQAPALQPDRRGVRGDEIREALARAAGRDRGPGAGRARRGRPVLPGRQRRGARPRDPARRAARPAPDRPGAPARVWDEVAAAMLRVSSGGRE